MLHASAALLADANEDLERYGDRGLGITAATTVAPLDRHYIDGGTRFDDDADGLMPRVDPIAVAAFHW